MKALFPLFAAVCLAVSLRAQAPATAYAPEQLDQMLGPIALYPDPLVALILPASTVPSDITLAEQYVAANGDPSQIDSQPWDKSVRGLAHYPDVLKWMNDNPDWTRALGAAFAMQPADVMKSVQQLRGKALAAGTLRSSAQQSVNMEGDNIRIVPAQSNTIYVPQYDPGVVYDVPEGYDGPFITYGIGYPVGAWLGYECDWDDFGIWIGPWRPGWGYNRDWRDPHFGGSRWRPDARGGHALMQGYYRPSGAIPSPRLTSGARSRVGGSSPGGRGSVTITHSQPDYRGYGAPAPATRAPASPVFGGYGRGTQAREYSNRGNASRQSPVRSAPATRSAPASGGREHR